MARAKRTERSEARRRWRADHTEHALTDAPPESATEAATASDAAQEPRRGLFGTLLASFRRPNYRADLAAAPAIFMQRRLLWVPFGIMLFAAAVLAFSPVFAPGSDASGSWEVLLIQLCLPQPVLLYFAVGYLAPRASYVFGGALGGLAIALYLVIPLARGVDLGIGGVDLLMYMFSTILLFGVVQGALMAAVAAWYRDFLRSTASKNRARAEEKRKEGRRDARRPATGRQTPKGSPQAR